MGRNAIPTPDSGRPSKNNHFSCIAPWREIFWLFLPIFGSKNFFYPKYGLLGLKSLGFARAFTSRNKIASFLLGTPFSYFFGTFCNFLAISLQNSFFLLFFLFLVKQTINLVFLFLNFQGFTLLPWQKVGRIWLEITQIFKFLHFLAISLQNSPFFFLPSCQSNDRFGNFFSKFSRLHLSSTVAKSW